MRGFHVFYHYLKNNYHNPVPIRPKSRIELIKDLPMVLCYGTIAGFWEKFRSKVKLDARLKFISSPYLL